MKDSLVVSEKVANFLDGQKMAGFIIGIHNADQNRVWSQGFLDLLGCNLLVDRL